MKRMVDIGQLAVLGVNKAVIVNTAVRHTCCSFSRLVLIQLQPGDRHTQIWYFYLRSQRLTFPFLSPLLVARSLLFGQLNLRNTEGRVLTFAECLKLQPKMADRHI